MGTFPNMVLVPLDFITIHHFIIIITPVPTFKYLIQMEEKEVTVAVHHPVVYQPQQQGVCLGFQSIMLLQQLLSLLHMDIILL